ncbi:MAG: aminotransferase class I/II-fold pyridoxal phosphate-dependent enzyme [Deltaproteobacteria bacterium]|nr:MAG: aminotransferase class I/II-fold pyridoxal phosphate-dependent enzyme [Deltaproteobacteria bacterium]
MAGRIETIAVRGGEPRKSAYDAVTTPIVCAATYAFEDTAEIVDYFEGRKEREEYGRYGNPTVRAAERKIAALEGAEDCALFASGMAAVTTAMLELLKTGDHVVMTSDCYRRTRQFVRQFLGRFGVEVTLVDPGDTEKVAAAVRPGHTRLIVSESPTNPYLRIADLRALVRVRDLFEGVNLLVDSTFATPANQRALDFGVDLSLQSGTKYLGYLLLRGMKTLPLRVERQNQSALQIARFLEADRRVRRVWYPGLASHPDHAVAREQMKGFGGVVTFQLDADAARTSRFVDACKLATIAPSLGAVETLIEQPALMSYFELTTQQREAIGISDSLVRLSVGIEACEDLMEDLGQALDAAFR